MKIEIKDTGAEPTQDYDAEWVVTIDGRRRTVHVWLGSGYYGAREQGPSGAPTVESDRLRDAVAMAVSPDVDYTSRLDSTAAIRRAVRDLTRCLEIRAAMRGVKLPKLRSAK